MKLRYLSILVIIISIVLITSACNLKDSDNVENQIMKKVPFPQSTNILHTENYKDGTIILYEDQTGFRADFFSIKDDYFSGGGNANGNPKDGFNWTMRNSPKIPLVLFAGVITDEEIKEVIVKQKTLKRNAKIIEINEGKRIWFTTFDVLEKADNGKSDPLKIEAYDNEGNMYWKDGIYEEGYFYGRTK
ncbi:hypothetical protein [Paenisporosarcina quisquiliarum]|uniref:hypothetical protein n=1 Tax=Paenisporosarcina quisquiliarum TaxID=365346 RepID=UPI0037351844